MADNPDMGLGVRFYFKAVENPRKSKEAARPIFDNVEYIQIGFPADNKREHHAPADEMHFVPHYHRQMTYAERFPEVYAAFKKDESELVNGTPLSELPALTEAQRAEFKSQKIQTVEQLAALPDTSIKRLGMGARPAVEAAQAYLSRADGTAEIAALRRQIEELKAQTGTPPAAVNIADEFDGMTDDDLKNMLIDAGVEVDGRWGRKRMAEELQNLTAKKTEAA